MAPNVAVRAVESYLEGLRRKDLTGVPLADNVTFESPLASASGAEAVKGALAAMFPAIDDVRVVRCVADGEHVSARFDLHTPFGVIPVFDHFRVSGGQIAEIRPFFDPRPITSAQPA